jgi:hypothetical protein
MTIEPASLNRLPKTISYALFVVLILVAGLTAYLQLRPGHSKASAFEEPATLIRMCSSCGGVFEAGTKVLRDKGDLDLEGVNLMGEGKVCPKCHKPTLKLAKKCPIDSTVFVPDTLEGTDSKAAHCPKCGWNPFAGQ